MRRVRRLQNLFANHLQHRSTRDRQARQQSKEATNLAFLGVSAGNYIIVVTQTFFRFVCD